ncbi:fluoride efflux transporter CrcB [Rhodanobacter hydrolyticus]|uniref:fluoride efflux transporter CrcB n=1 Tax=Rhodanobacter hydrolyticus TaxID=2250595 RepID=UPI00384E08EE
MPDVSFAGFVAVGLGGMLGCWLRWMLGVLLNPVFPTLPLGTLAANLIGGIVMGLVMAVFSHYPAIPQAVQLFATTGFLGGLTTFSTFSAEANTLLLRRQSLWTFIHVTAHLAGTLALTMLGIVLVRSVLH